MSFEVILLLITLWKSTSYRPRRCMWQK